MTNPLPHRRFGLRSPRVVSAVLAAGGDAGGFVGLAEAAFEDLAISVRDR